MDIIVPVKRFSEAKTRLAGPLLPVERANLARLLVSTILEQLARVRRMRRVILASSEPSLEQMAARFGFEMLIDDPQSPGLNAAVDRAVAQSVASGATDVGVVFSDLPLFNTKEFESILDVHLGGAPFQVTIVLDRFRTGTNVRLCRPGDLLPSLYGRNSAIEHQRAAALRGAEIRVVESDCFPHDLDQLADIQPILDLADQHAVSPALLAMFRKWANQDFQRGQSKCV